MREWSFGFPSSKSSTAAPAVTETPVVSAPSENEPAAIGPVAAPPVVVPYERFLERRAWREKIAADFHQADGTGIDIKAVRTEAPNAEAIPPHH
jgi:hypothetical protein